MIVLVNKMIKINLPKIKMTNNKPKILNVVSFFLFHFFGDQYNTQRKKDMTSSCSPFLDKIS
jgi:hypothetical protein